MHTYRPMPHKLHIKPKHRKYSASIENMIPMNMTHTHTQKAEMQSKGTHDTSEEGSDAWEKWEQWEAAVAEGMKARKNSREKRMQEERQAGVEERAKQVVAWTEELDRCAKIETKLLDSDNMASVSTPCFDVYCARPQFFWKIDTECAPYQLKVCRKYSINKKSLGCKSTSWTPTPMILFCKRVG